MKILNSGNQQNPLNLRRNNQQAAFSSVTFRDGQSLFRLELRNLSQTCVEKNNTKSPQLLLKLLKVMEEKRTNNFCVALEKKGDNFRFLTFKPLGFDVKDAVINPENPDSTAKGLKKLIRFVSRHKEQKTPELSLPERIMNEFTELFK